MTKQKTNDIIMILDESIGGETIQVVNNFIKEQQKLEIKDTRFSLIKFNSGITYVFNDEKLENIKEFTNLKPDNTSDISHSSLDCIGVAITNKLESERKTDVICVILTNGEDCCSDFFSLSNIKSLIKKVETFYGWYFVYSGTNQDVFKISTSLGINSFVECFPDKNEDFINITRSVSEKVSLYRQKNNTKELKYLNIETKKLKIEETSQEKLPSPLPPLNMSSRLSAIGKYTHCI